MKKVFLSVFSILSTVAFLEVSAQCTPATIAGFGLNPTQAQGLPVGNSGESYSADVTFRLQAPTKIRISDLGLPAVPGLDPNAELDFAPDFMVISMTGLPAGLSIACNVPGCEYAPNATGCFRISGTPTVIGNFSSAVTASYGGTASGLAALIPLLPGVPNEIEVGGSITLPSIPGLFPGGNFNIPLYSVSEQPYQLSIAGTSVYEFNPTTDFRVNSNFPNPFSTYTDINVFTEKMTDIQVIVRDLNGRVVKTVMVLGVVGESVIRLNSDGYSNGTYICEVNNGTSRTTFKMVVSK